MSRIEPPPEPQGREEPSVAQLINRLPEQTSRLIRDEVALAKVELKDSVRHAVRGAGMFGAAGMLAHLGVITLVATAVIALALLLPWWLSALIVGVVLLLVAGALALVGKAQIRQASPPEHTVDNLKQDVHIVQESSHGRTR